MLGLLMAKAARVRFLARWRGTRYAGYGTQVIPSTEPTTRTRETHET
jgi:hypothetical protein